MQPTGQQRKPDIELDQSNVGVFLRSAPEKPNCADSQALPKYARRSHSKRAQTLSQGWPCLRGIAKRDDFGSWQAVLCALHLSGRKLGDLLSHFRRKARGHEPTCRTNKFFTFFINYG